MLKNLSKKTLISKKIIKLDSFNKFIGLMGKRKPESFFIKTRFGIHTLFLKFNIDLLVLDNKNRVVFLKNGVRPNSFVVWNPKFDTVIELPEGSIENSNTKKADILEISL